MNQSPIRVTVWGENHHEQHTEVVQQLYPTGMHTVITEDFGHRGLARALVEASLEAARDNGWKVRPVCSYVQRFLAGTTEFDDVIAA